MSKVNCAVIGAGWWGTTAHIPALKGHSGANLVAVQRRALDQVQKVARDFEIPHAFTDPLDLIGLDGLQAVRLN